MKNIFNIYFTDVRKIVKNWAAAIIILGLIILPSLYAWFNIEASWDPYGNTKGLSIAIVNKDRGTTIRDHDIKMGDMIVDSLKQNEAIGWKFVDEATALNGVMHGKYYASIVIPEDFSEKIATIISDNPQKPELDYSVNEKINAVAPKITSKGASSIIEKVSYNFTKTVNEKIFSVLHDLGIELEQNLPSIERVKDLVFRLEKEFPQINEAVNLALTDAQKAQDIVSKAQSDLPLVVELTKNAGDLSKGLTDFLDKSGQALQTAAPNIKGELNTLRQIASSSAEITAILQNPEIDPATAKQDLNTVKSRLESGIKIIDGIVNFLDRLNSKASPQPAIKDVIDKLNKVKAMFQKQIDYIQAAINAIDKGEKPAEDIINGVNQISKDSVALLDDILGKYDSTIVPAISAAVDQAKTAAKDASTVLQDAQNSLPDVSKLLSDASKGITVGKEEVTKIQKELPAIESKIKQIADRIRQFESTEDIHQIIDLLKHDVEKESDFLANPVVLKENRLYPIPNYGSGMSPFFSTLSLWVGALLLVSLLTTEVHHPEKAYKSYQVYFGRFLTFLTIALLQSVIVTMGDIYLLGTYVSNPLWFILFGLINSAVFMLMVYTLVSVFGNVGKAMAIIMLVLQLAGSGGTFPIQVTPPFFQMIHPFLPFTYAISMMREAVGGIIWDIVLKDIAALCIYVVITLMLGLLFKKHINKHSAKMVKKAKESGLLH